MFDLFHNSEYIGSLDDPNDARAYITAYIKAYGIYRLMTTIKVANGVLISWLSSDGHGEQIRILIPRSNFKRS